MSHDVAFLDNTSTDVIHYERRDVWGPYNKLVHYKGNMAEFAKHPQSKSYFRELAKEQGPLCNFNRGEEDDNMLRFHFPDPGRLEGIKTSTQKFIEMENVDFQYLGSDKNQLTNINLKMSLSSRVVVLGANGAGDFIDCLSVSSNVPLCDLTLFDCYFRKNNFDQNDCW